MGLSERKQKQKIGNDPRNLGWSNDSSRFSYKHMTNLGWTDKSGIGGSDLSGNPNHIAVARKLDNSGIGVGRARKEGEELSSGAGQAGRGLEDVLKRLAAAAAVSAPSTPEGLEEEGSASSGDVEMVEVATEVAVKIIAPVPRRNASRARHLLSKKMASQSPAALAEILGVPVSSLPSSPSPSISTSSTPVASTSTPLPAVEADDGNPKRDAEEIISTSTLSVGDYFRQKLREKMLARQAASGPSTPLPETSLALLKETPNVAIGGAGWEGSKVTFQEEQVELGDLSGEVEEKLERKKKDRKGKKAKVESEEPSVVAVEVDEKAEKRSRKEAKKLAKAAKEGAESRAEVKAEKRERKDKEGKRRRREGVMDEAEGALEKKAKKSKKEKIE
ncbi:Pin2-interacting protein X1, partial [Tremellales sp. Uapishka_1]